MASEGASSGHRVVFLSEIRNSHFSPFPFKCPRSRFPTFDFATKEVDESVYEVERLLNRAFDYDLKSTLIDTSNSTRHSNS